MARKERKKNLCRHMTSYGECTLTEEPCVQGPCSREEPEEWVPVVHGRKIEDGDIGCFWLCSLCGECLPYGANYCPNCGAKMDGDGNG